MNKDPYEPTRIIIAPKQRAVEHTLMLGSWWVPRCTPSPGECFAWMPSDSYSQYGMANFQANWKFLKASRTRGSWVVLGMIYVPLSLGNLFQILPMIWVAPSLISFLSFSSPVELSYKNSEIFGLHRLWWVEQGSEVSCVATGRPNWKSGGWLLGKRNKLPCRLGWGVLLVLKQIQYYPPILGILGSKESVGKREGKNKTLTPASASPFRYIPIYSLAIPCMLHSSTFGTV